MDSEETNNNQSALDKLRSRYNSEYNSDPVFAKRIDLFAGINKQMIVNGYVEPPRLDNPTPAQRADEMARRLAYAAGGILLDNYKEKQLQILKTYEAEQREKLLDFQPYDSLEQIVLEWPNSMTTMVEVKFVKPSRLSDWESTIIMCSTMVKVFKTVEYHMANHLHLHNFIYENKRFFKKTTHIFEYDPTNFAFVVRTGLGSGGQRIRNCSVPFYKEVREQLHFLLNEMKTDLPSSHYEYMMEFYHEIKNRKTNSIGF